MHTVAFVSQFRRSPSWWPHAPHLRGCFFVRKPWPPWAIAERSFRVSRCYYRLSGLLAGQRGEHARGPCSRRTRRCMATHTSSGHCTVSRYRMRPPDKRKQRRQQRLRGINSHVVKVHHLPILDKLLRQFNGGGACQRALSAGGLGLGRTGPRDGSKPRKQAHADCRNIRWCLRE